MFGEFTLFKHLVKIVWRMNRSAKGLLILTTNLDGLVWQIADDMPNLLNFLPIKHSHYHRYMVYTGRNY